MVKFLLFIVMLFLLVACDGGSTPTPQITPSPDTVQPAMTCDQIITTALEDVNAACSALGRGQACYGHDHVEAELQPDTTAKFDESGDIADLASLRSLRTVPPDEKAEIWGLVVIKAQVNLPETLPGQNVTFLLFGDSTLNNFTSDMRLLSLNTNFSEPKCQDAPQSSLLIQSPQGTEVTMNINGAEVTVGSTLYVTAQQQQNLRIATIEGQALVKAADVVQVVEPGTQVNLPLGGNGGLEVVGPPSSPEPFEAEVIEHAPVTVLERKVVIPPPATPSIILTPTTAPSPTPGGANLTADETVLGPGECTTIRWDVTDAKQVFFEGQPTRASSTREVCPTSTKTYALLVIRQDDSQEFYNVNITVTGS
jgi:hypothetical protein